MHCKCPQSGPLPSGHSLPPLVSPGWGMRSHTQRRTDRGMSSEFCNHGHRDKAPHSVISARCVEQEV
uniref:Uncharacterized protein n=1 Tax=Anguilla anguilla TaxID=7936 RepID=A0A0E9P5I1_ANGAN